MLPHHQFEKIILFFFIFFHEISHENNGEYWSSQQKCIQMTLDFPIISITHFDSNHKKGKINL